MPKEATLKLTNKIQPRFLLVCSAYCVFEFLTTFQMLFLFLSGIETSRKSNLK